VAAGIDEAGAGRMLKLRCEVSIFLMDVPEEHMRGMPAGQEVIKTGEASVRQIVMIAETLCGGVCDQDVKASRDHDFGCQFPDAPAHLLFRIHIFSGTVPHGAAEPENAQAIVIVKPVVNSDAPARGIFIVDPVVVSPDVEEGTAYHCHQKLQIVRIQIPAGDDEVGACQAGGIVIIPKGLILFVTDYENFHVYLLPGLFGYPPGFRL